MSRSRNVYHRASVVAADGYRLRNGVERIRLSLEVEGSPPVTRTYSLPAVGPRYDALCTALLPEGDDLTEDGTFELDALMGRMCVVELDARGEVTGLLRTARAVAQGLVPTAQKNKEETMRKSDEEKVMVAALAALNPVTLASVLATHGDGGWAVAEGCAIGPCPWATEPRCTDPTAALAYPVMGGWAPWVRCTICGEAARVDDLLRDRLGSEDLAGVLQSARALPTLLRREVPKEVAEVETYFARDKVIEAMRDVDVPAIVLGAHVGPARESGEPRLALDLGLWHRGQPLRAPKFIPYSAEAEMTSALRALLPNLGDELPPNFDLSTLAGCLCTATARRTGEGEFGPRTKIAGIKPALSATSYVGEVPWLIALCQSVGRRA